MFFDGRFITIVGEVCGTFVLSQHCGKARGRLLGAEQGTVVFFKSQDRWKVLL